MKGKILILLFAAFLTALLACKKSGDIAPVAKGTFINIVNATSDTLNFYQNGTRLNNTTNLYPSGSIVGVGVALGTQNYQLKKAGNLNTLTEFPLTTDTLTFHTLFIAGEAANQMFLTKDVLKSDTGNSVRVRYINASPMTTNLDVYIGSKIVCRNMAFKSETGYMNIASGTNALSIYQAGTTTLLASGTISVTSGLYTLYTKGGITGNVFGARILNR